uniref:Uncharacterized protein n=1 Tax=Candidatus Kentrum sp. TC TaxID=2126339 RepID=A0A450ZR27_9GAMM|nr:MAG: hypothetical protein BECKTC1821F_GA0114240_100940 [Candidatus Kentron sp. TC]
MVLAMPALNRSPIIRAPKIFTDESPFSRSESSFIEDATNRVRAVSVNLPSRFVGPRRGLAGQSFLLRNRAGNKQTWIMKHVRAYPSSPWPRGATTPLARCLRLEMGRMRKRAVWAGDSRIVRVAGKHIRVPMTWFRQEQDTLILEIRVQPHRRDRK